MKSSAVYSASPASLRNRRPARVAVLLLNLFDLDADDVPAALLVLQQRADLPHPPALLLQLLADDQDLEPRQAVDLQLEDGVGLLGVELEPLDDLLRGVLPCLPTSGRSSGSRRARRRPSRSPRGCGCASCSASSSCSSRLVTTSSRKCRKCQSIAWRSSRSGRPTSGVLGRNQAGQVDDEAGLERRVLEQVRHHHLLVRVASSARARCARRRSRDP